jgi:hypothetical protein
MDLVNLLSKLQAISEADDKADKDYDGDGKVESGEEEHKGAVDKAIKKAKANEDIENVLRGLQAIQEAEDDKCPECGKAHEGECKEEVEEGFADMAKKGLDVAKKVGQKALDTLGHGSDEELLKDLQKRSGVPPHAQHGKPNMARQNESFDELRALAGIQECGEIEMSPMTVVGGEPQMGVNPAMPAEVPTIGAQPEAEPEMAAQAMAQAEPEQKASYTLTISNGESSLNMTTDAPDEIIHVMKLAGVKGEAKVEKQAPGQDDQGADQQGEEQKTEESFGNTPAQTNEPNPRIQGDINNWSQKGTGQAPNGSAMNKPAGQGDNPMRESLSMLEEYRKFLTK